MPSVSTTISVSTGTSATVSTGISTISNQPNETDVNELFQRCSSSKAIPILFSIEDEPYCSSFIKSSEHLPLPLQSLYDPATFSAIM